MITKKITLLIALLFTSPASFAVVDGNDLLAGAATGLLARGTSFALKQQGHTTNQQAMIGAAFATALLTVAVQSNKQGGSMRGGVAQLAAAFATFVTTLYVWPTIGDEDQNLYYGKSHDDTAHATHEACNGHCKH